MSKCINVDELQEWVENWFYKNRCYHPYAKSNTIPINELYDILENMPAADVAEVKHGRWVYVKKRLARGGYVDASECSVCSKIIMPHLKPDYCPNCGAKMDKECENESR